MLSFLVVGCFFVGSKTTSKSSSDIIIKSTQYTQVAKDSLKLDIIITDTLLLSTILTSFNPTILIVESNDILIVKGNPILSSSVPQGCNYFYPIDSTQKMTLVNNGRVVFYSVR